ncbi:MAG: RNA methyltransferase, partial [Kribbellaceae bacterium]|nr:RNA methyltransferase [Kribbellaceae bacterium]
MGTGLEWVLADEVTAAGHRVVEVSKRQVIVEPRRDGIVGEPPRVADDLFEVYGAVPDPGRSRAGLVGAVRAAVERAPVGRGAFAVSASFVGVRNFNRYDVEDAVGERIARLTGGRYHSRRHGAVPPHGRTEWRVVLDGKTVWIA